MLYRFTKLGVIIYSSKKMGKKMITEYFRKCLIIK